MHALSAPGANLRVPSRSRMTPPLRSEGAMRHALVAESIGNLVPRTDFTGRVHTVFARACNFTCDDMLLTLYAGRACDGPTTLRLVPGAPADLRDLFEIDEPVLFRRGRMWTERAEVDLMQASIWHPVRSRPRLRRLARCHGARESVIVREAASLLTSLCDACAALDGEGAQRQVARLIGLGEGLTPAGDDFLLGLLAGLDAQLCSDAARQQFRDVLASEYTAHAHRTTPISAHFLRLAAGGHYTAPVIDLRDALLGEECSNLVDRALAAALSVGATSGADTVSGLLAGLTAWMTPAPATAAGRP